MPAPHRNAARPGEQRRAHHAARPADHETARRPLVRVGAAVGQRQVGDVEDARGSSRPGCRCRRPRTRPAHERPGSNSSPGLYAAKQIVSVARTAGPATAPVVPFTPDGMSTASTGTRRRRPSTRATAAAGPSSAPRKPVPYIASITRSARPNARVSSRVAEAGLERQLVDADAEAAQPPRRDVSVGAVVALAGRRRRPGGRTRRRACGARAARPRRPRARRAPPRACRPRSCAGRPPPSRPASAPAASTASSSRPGARRAR